MTPLAMKSRNCLIDDIKCLESQLSALQERFNVIVNWIRSQYVELNGLPHIVVVAVRGSKGSIEDKLESTRGAFPLENIEHVKVECDDFDGSADTNAGYKIESDDQFETSVDKLDVDTLKDVGLDSVSIKSPVATIADRQSFEAQEENINWKNEQLDEDNSTVADETDDSDHSYSDNNDSESSSTARPIPSNMLRSSKGVPKKNVEKRKREKGFIWTADEYKEKIASLPKRRRACVVCGKNFLTTARVRRHEIDVHLTKEDGVICRSDKRKALKRDTKKNVKKTTEYLQANIEKGLILTAFEYKELVAPLPRERLTCAICGKDFPTPTILRRHEIGVHLTKEELQKLRANPLRASKGGIKMNVERKKREKGFILTASEYKEMIAPLPKGRLSCAICFKDFATTSRCRRHELLVHLTKEERQKSRYCILDLQKAENDGVTMCDICNFPFKNIETHKKNHLPPGVITKVEGSDLPHYRCSKCHALFRKKKTYLSHVATDCTAEGTLKIVNSDQHKDERRTEKNFLCNQCGQSFNRLYTLKVHELAVHANKRDFKCQFCDKRFVIEYKKKLHERNHLGTSTVTCDLCGYSFRGKQVLKKHIRGVHLNRRLYQCPLCDKRFKTSTARNYHINTHGNPNGRQRSLNADVDPLRAAAKRRHCMVINLTHPQTGS